MDKSSKIYIAGHTGLVGSAITAVLVKNGYNNLIYRHQSELDLTNQKAVDDFFATERPEYVFLAAAMVGGIVANNTYRADFIYHNIMIQSNVIHASWKHSIKKLLFLGSTCIYPKNAPQPMKESYLLTSTLEHTNEPYAIAKIAGLKMCESFNLQYKTNFIAVMPTNLYGPGDNFNLEKSHVLPALMRKIHLGKCLERSDWTRIRKDLLKNPIENVNGNSEENAIIEILHKYGIIIADKPYSNLTKSRTDNPDNFIKVTVNVWGTGTPYREFMYSRDMAEACLYVMENVEITDIIRLNQSANQFVENAPHFINIGTGEEVQIKELAYKIKALVGFNGEIVFDDSKPDGPSRKATNSTLLKRLGYIPKFDLNAGLGETYDNYFK